MKVLQLCKKSPTPQKDGESIAIHQISKALVMSGASLDVLAMLTSKHPNKDLASELQDACYVYVPIDTSIRYFKAATAVFGRIPYLVQRFRSDAYEQALLELLKNNTYDYIILEGVFLGLYLDLIIKHSKAKLVLRAHNVENQIWKRIAAAESNFFRKQYFKHFVIEGMKTFEQDVLLKIDGVISISPIDNQYFKLKKVQNTLMLPVCVEAVEEPEQNAAFTVGFLGGMDWLPNQNGVAWFVENVWQKFIQKHPEAVFNFAGRNFPEKLYALKAPQINPMGEIENAADFIKKQSILIAPIFSGSGMRVKIIEAMSLGKTVLSTSIGAEGIDCENNKDILIGEDAVSWLCALDAVYLDRGRLLTIGAAAANLMRKEYALPNHAKALEVFLQQV